MSIFLARSCSVLLIIFFIKLGSDGVSGMGTYQAGEMGPALEQTPLDKLEEEVISDLKTELDELEMEASSFYNMQKKYQELDSQGQCTNKHQSCIAWSCRDECHKNPAYMRRQCTWSCGACGPQHSCVDKKKDCDYWMKQGECYKNPAFMLENCCWSCMTCPKGSCKDRHRHCSYWACIGECQRNPRYMLINCRESCNVCHKDNNKPVVAGQNCPQPQIKVPQPTCNEKVDIIVLMDGSASVMARNFPDVRNFVLSLAAGFTMPAAQMGVYQYAHNVQREIGLNQFKTREDLLEGIKKIKFLNGMATMTGEALTRVYRDLANGGRKGVQKVIILVTDGQASDNVQIPSQNIKSNNVLISAVGVANYNLDQLNEIATGSKFVATVKQFDAMNSIRDKVWKAVCQAQQKRGQDMDQEINNGLQYLKRMLGALEDELEQETRK